MSTARPFKTDVSVKTSLNTGLLPGAGGSGRMGGRGGGGGGQTGAGAEKEVSSEEYLDRFEEELHKKVDAEMEILVDGLGDCVRLSKVGNKDKFKAAQDALEVELKAESMVRATESLLSLSHTLKMLFLLDDEDKGSAQVQERQRKEAEEELQAVKDQARELFERVQARQ